MSAGKNTGKIVEKVVENGGEWRFFEGPKRHSAVPDASEADRNSSVWQMLRLWSSAASSSLWPAKSAVGRHFRGPGHETTYVGRGRFDDYADFAVRVGRPALSLKSPAFDLRREHAGLAWRLVTMDPPTPDPTWRGARRTANNAAATVNSFAFHSILCAFFSFYIKRTAPFFTADGSDPLGRHGEKIRWGKTCRKHYATVRSGSRPAELAGSGRRSARIACPCSRGGPCGLGGGTTGSSGAAAFATFFTLTCCSHAGTQGVAYPPSLPPFPPLDDHRNGAVMV